ncbi:MAG: M20/M25/M40 family metallo-hydrolase, partial [Deltaproteobacteria bacterium]|nr:M20/M25/M40 family metallo-hydrolase [Deltaproteobacteria bacterium]
HDVQPPGRDEVWVSPAFEPSIRKAQGGDRLFGRGSADDKAGVVIHTASISSFLETLGSLPVNVKVIIEGEEEIGSHHLREFVNTYKDLLQADALILTDAGNFDIGVPALTVALRGIVAVEVELRALTKTIHSGVWGGPIPDPAIALCKVLGSLVDEKGRIKISGVLEQVRPLDEKEKEELSRIPCNEKTFREQAGLLPNVELLKEGPSVLSQTWRFPSITVNAIQASSRKQSGNIINDSAWAKVSIRLVPDMDPEKVLKLLQNYIARQVPWGLELNLKVEAASGAWSTDTRAPIFDVALGALEKGYGVKPFKMGMGGSIPFVAPLTETLGNVPALLVGAEDPYTNAHGENESLLLSDFKKACLSQIYMFSELAKG